jgi:hypothetical protein
MTNDFIVHAVGFLKGERQKANSANSRAVAEQNAKATKCPAFWTEVSSKITGICDAIQNTMGEQIFSWPESDGKNLLAVTAVVPSGKRTLNAKYDPNGHTISYSLDPAHSGRFTPVFIDGGIEYVDGNASVSSGQIAEKMVRALIGDYGK